MLVHEGESRTSKIDLLLATALAFVAGGVNSAGYLAFGYFSANMTGNVSMISDHLSIRELNAAIAFATIVVMFILGAFCASLFIEIGRQRRLSNIYALTLLAESALLMGVGLYTASSAFGGITIAGLLGFTMGIQNAASTRLSGSRVRTTHVSGIATDIGVGLALLIGNSTASDRAQTVRRLSLHGTTILSFLLGGIAGVLGYKLAGGMVFCVFAVILLALCARYLRSRTAAALPGTKT